MDPKVPKLQALLTTLNRDADPLKVAYAHNYLFEERVAPARQKAYEEGYPPDLGELKAWMSHQQSYLDNHVRTLGARTPETFTAANAEALLAGLDERQYLVRIETLVRPLRAQKLELAQLENLRQVAARDPESDRRQAATDLLAEFCRLWNQIRDNRPTFVAFYHEVEAEAGDKDWPHLLRNRLELSHYGVPAGAPPTPVALVRYRVEEVLGALAGDDGGGAFAFPAVLDGPLNSHYFPAPREAQYGRTLSLEPDPECERLVSEVLHRRIEYRPEHLFRLGQMTQPLPPHSGGAAFARRRNEHLFCVRYETNRKDFGARMAEGGDA